MPLPKNVDHCHQRLMKEGNGRGNGNGGSMGMNGNGRGMMNGNGNGKMMNRGMMNTPASEKKGG
jgi:hypothetical protein